MADFIADSFKQELLQGVHDFTNSTGDAFYWALFTNAWTGNNATTATYTTTNEVANGNGYTTGGVTIANVTPTVSSNVAYTDWATDPTWGTANFTARYTHLYNSTDSNKSVANWDFGTDQTASGGDFIIVLPTPASGTAILRLA